MSKIEQALIDTNYTPHGSKKAMVCFSMGLDSTTLAYYLKHRGWDVTLAYFDDGPWNTPNNGFFDANREVCKDDFLAKESNFYTELHNQDSGFDVAKFRYPQLNALAVQPNVGLPADTDKAKHAENLGMTFWVGYKMIMQNILLSHGAAYGFELVVMGHLPGEDAYKDEDPEVFSRMREAMQFAYPRVRMPDFENPYYDWDFEKTDVIKLAHAVNCPLQHTYSCRRTPAKFVAYPHCGYSHCGECEMCEVRAAAFSKAGLTDPALHD